MSRSWCEIQVWNEIRFERSTNKLAMSYYPVLESLLSSKELSVGFVVTGQSAAECDPIGSNLQLIHSFPRVSPSLKGTGNVDDEFNPSAVRWDGVMQTVRWHSWEVPCVRASSMRLNCVHPHWANGDSMSKWHDLPPVKGKVLYHVHSALLVTMTRWIGENSESASEKVPHFITEDLVNLRPCLLCY